MEFQTELIPARLVRRYKRFLADVRLPDGREVTAHCPNPGAMTGLAEPGARVWLEPNEDPRKKLKFGWRLTELAQGFACIDTAVANRVVAEALAARAVPGLGSYATLRPEVSYGAGSRVDFLLDGPEGPLHLEVKSVTLAREAGVAEFPDTRTARGEKHLRELAAVAAGGGRAALLYLVQRSDCTGATLAADIDPGYAAAASEAARAGVAMLAHGTEIGPGGVRIGRVLPFDLTPV